MMWSKVSSCQNAPDLLRTLLARNAEYFLIEARIFVSAYGVCPFYGKSGSGMVLAEPVERIAWTWFGIIQ